MSIAFGAPGGGGFDEHAWVQTTVENRTVHIDADTHVAALPNALRQLLSVWRASESRATWSVRVDNPLANSTIASILDPILLEVGNVTLHANAMEPYWRGILCTRIARNPNLHTLSVGESFVVPELVYVLNSRRVYELSVTFAGSVPRASVPVYAQTLAAVTAPLGRVVIERCDNVQAVMAISALQATSWWIHDCTQGMTEAALASIARSSYTADPSDRELTILSSIVITGEVARAVAAASPHFGTFNIYYSAHLTQNRLAFDNLLMGLPPNSAIRSAFYDACDDVEAFFEWMEGSHGDTPYPGYLHINPQEWRERFS